ncbi:hypothetical protein PUNSTDRAFT_138362 [Punctularia strigosozonata HHB-11173 SS5]|uniref:Uncharacterized protein n=1 Tax=Punctularia strigosozonata (strain HHB-11173) TaxID=741275 RepID=R7S5L5_PUNST|nr:uncharacterized protein PUNSTDRAFT_138362 [Punctularia strigosozonata HHB-11173 SS5]EIN04716.1 hypothetical protein PUNSTDRAFT_138362 [Punctularia strigosozonata HHB-11173 SS5]
MSTRSFELVTADGTLIHDSPYVHQDLFWALRGGGCPSFGMVTSTKYKLHPEQAINASYFEAYTITLDAFVQGFEVFHNAQGPLAPDGIRAYSGHRTSFAWTYINLNTTNVDQADKSITPLINNVAQIPGNGSPDAIGYNYTAGDVVAVNGHTVPRLLPTSLFTDEPVHQPNQSAINLLLVRLSPARRPRPSRRRRRRRAASCLLGGRAPRRSSLINLGVRVGCLNGAPPHAREAAETAQTYDDRFVSLTRAWGTHWNEMGYWEGDFTRPISLFIDEPAHQPNQSAITSSLWASRRSHGHPGMFPEGEDSDASKEPVNVVQPADDNLIMPISVLCPRSIQDAKCYRHLLRGVEHGYWLAVIPGHRPNNASTHGTRRRRSRFVIFAEDAPHSDDAEDPNLIAPVMIHSKANLFF